MELKRFSFQVIIKVFVGFFVVYVFGSVECFSKEKYNILFIAVDDLKPNTGSYGDKFAITPGMDKLANEGIIFQQAYCQQAICAASRASIMSGLRPDKTRVWDLVTYFRQVNPNIVTMPEYFKNNGYTTAATGKIYHESSSGIGHDEVSWTVPYRDPKTRTYALENKLNERGKGKATESADVADNFYHDGKMTEMAIELMDSLSKSRKPFFLAVGFQKPHLPFIAPKKYWDLYDRSKFEIAPYQKKAINSPEEAYHASGELKSYTDIPQFDSYSENKLNNLPIKKQRELIHGYYASMSYTDAQILLLLKKLEKLGIRKKTIIVLWGDHGWHLGDHGLWNKHTNFEQAARTLLIMSAPGMKQGLKSESVCEFIDVYPTLCDLNGIEKPNYLDGVSLVPVLKNPLTPVREYALSQYPRGKDKMGYSIRTSRFRYTVWFKDGFNTSKLYDQRLVIARELYDYKKDPLEKENMVDKLEYVNDKALMEKLFSDCMLREYKSNAMYSKIADYQTPIVVGK